MQGILRLTLFNREENGWERWLVVGLVGAAAVVVVVSDARAEGGHYQTTLNRVLREYMLAQRAP